uniref:Cell division protein FtsX n=1 Tax=Candidatus Kentrum sp. SD TaxID=2126332 RepID=A0A450YHR4_9GAMM|nr:MAG: cell division transport system permease protein [Candidatus Kentron sp. SD]VFK41086.1 MAG: cell division transport system permease protein [Candidatus Kentron sp. SD]VFK78877.1 MAG: cell division transport system permease protein [Candidatus Kentron sp. SD]
MMSRRRITSHGKFIAPKREIGVGPRQRLRLFFSNLARSTPRWIKFLGGISITWAIRHLQVIFASIGQLANVPIATLMTGAVIGIGLALPAGLYVLLENAREMSRGWEGAIQISLFLKIDKTDNDARLLAKELRKHPRLERVRVITRSQALTEYQQLSGFDAVIEALGGENPLPAVLVLYPIPSYSSLTSIQRMLDELQKRDEVESAQFDLQWLKRLYTMMEIMRRGILSLAILLALGVLLIVGNTIRLDIWNRRDEIEIAKLFGASNAFIRRPFLYTGLWYGLLGGGIAWIFVATFFRFLRGPINELAALYHGNISLIFVGTDILFILLAAGAILGISGSWLAVGRHLGAIEPS